MLYTYIWYTNTFVKIFQLSIVSVRKENCASTKIEPKYINIQYNSITSHQKHKFYVYILALLLKIQIVSYNLTVKLQKPYSVHKKSMIQNKVWQKHEGNMNHTWPVTKNYMDHTWPVTKNPKRPEEIWRKHKLGPLSPTNLSKIYIQFPKK